VPVWCSVRERRECVPVWCSVLERECVPVWCSVLEKRVRACVVQCARRECVPVWCSVPRVAFINKLDRTGADPWKVIDALRKKLRHNCAAVQVSPPAPYLQPAPSTCRAMPFEGCDVLLTSSLLLPPAGPCLFKAVMCFLPPACSFHLPGHAFLRL